MILYIQELSNKLKDTEKVMSMELHQVTIHYTILAAVSISQLYWELTHYIYLPVK